MGAFADRFRARCDPGAAYEWLIQPVARELARTGALTPGEGDRLLGDLRERAATGRYFLARTYYTFSDCERLHSDA